jgi:hypothetical protein
VALKVRLVGATLRLGGVGGGAVGIGVATLRVTGTDSGLFEALLFVNETLPV